MAMRVVVVAVWGKERERERGGLRVGGEMIDEITVR